MLARFKKKKNAKGDHSLSEVEIISTTTDQIHSLSVKGQHRLVIAYLHPDCPNPESIMRSIGQKFSDIPNRLVLMSAGILGGNELYNQTATSRQVLLHFFPKSLIGNITHFEIPVSQDSEAIERSISSLVRVPFDIDPRDTFGLIYFPGLTASESYFCDAILNSSVSPTHLIGGSAGGKLDFSQADVFFNEKQHSNKCVLLYCKLTPEYHYDIFRTHNFKPTNLFLMLLISKNRVELSKPSISTIVGKQ
ncbi:FIST N-terminal domain-containing protein [Vibrio paucivorans]